MIMSSICLRIDFSIEYFQVVDIELAIEKINDCEAMAPVVTACVIGRQITETSCAPSCDKLSVSISLAVFRPLVEM